MRTSTSNARIDRRIAEHRVLRPAALRIAGLIAGTATLPLASAAADGLAPICSAGRAFPTRLQYVAGRSWGAVAADLNGDGLTDVVSRHAADGSAINDLLVLLASSEGTFIPRPFVPVSNILFQIATGDFDGDGLPDVAITTDDAYPAGTVSVYLNDRAGNLALAGSAPCGAEPAGLATGDFNADGNTDLVVSSSAESALHVFLGDGRGGLAEGPVLANVKAGPVVARDFDQDGLADIAIASPGALRVFRGSADLAFPETSGGILPPQTKQLEAADVDRDGRLDLVARGTSLLTILRQDDAGFQEIDSLGVTAEKPMQFALVDLDGDDAPEIVARPSDTSGCVSGGEPYCAWLLKNDGSGQFEWSEKFVVGRAVGFAIAGSFNGDDAPDLGFLQSYSSYETAGGEGWIAVLPGSPSGVETSSIQALAASFGSAALAADLDGDGLAEVVAAGLQTQLGWMPNLGAGAFGDPVGMSLPGSFSLKGIAVADLNGDGSLDVAATGQTSSSNGKGVAILMQNPALSLFYGANMVESAADCNRIVAADLDADGDCDLAATTWQPTGACILMNLGNGQFAPPLFIPLSGARAITTLDLQQDGLPEIVVGDVFSNRIWLVPNLGGQVFGDPVEILLPPVGEVQDLASGDLDSNGTLDLVATLGSPDHGPVVHVVALLVDTNNQLGPPLDTGFAAAGIQAVVLGNLTPDGRLDAAVTHGPNSGFTVLAGQGDGHFQPIGTYGTVQGAPIAIADFDLDGDDDVVSVRGQVLVHENRSELIRLADLDCDGTVGPIDLGALLADWGPCAASGCAPGDLDGDGEIGSGDLAILLSEWGT